MDSPKLPFEKVPPKLQEIILMEYSPEEISSVEDWMPLIAEIGKKVSAIAFEKARNVIGKKRK